MSHLHELQQRFQRYLTDGDEAFYEDIVSTENALAEHRLAAYYNAYRIRLIDCLATDFSALKKVLGDEDFELLILDYLARYPSRHPSVRWVGEKLAQFLTENDKREDRDFLAELARFEWTQGLAFDAPEADCLFTIEQMAMIPPEAWPNLHIHFHPSVHWLDLYWNAPQMAVADDNGTALPEPERGVTPIRWLLWRKQHSPNWRSLDVHEAWALEAAKNGANFAELCEGLIEWIDAEHVALTAAGFLKQWIEDELVTRVNSPQT